MSQQQSQRALFIERRGRGRSLLLIHGSATDSTTWSLQLAGLARDFEVTAYDRRGSGKSDPALCVSLDEHVRDAELVLGDRQEVLVCGSSFGGIVALELARKRPERVAGLVLCEPPMPAWDDVPAVPAGFGCHFDRISQTRSPPAAAEFFLRTVLGASAFARLPARWQARSCGYAAQIRADSLALARYRPNYPALRQFVVPTWLVTGARSPEHYREPLETLVRVLPRVELHELASAGHMMHAEAFRSFNRLIHGCRERLWGANKA